MNYAEFVCETTRLYKYFNYCVDFALKVTRSEATEIMFSIQHILNLTSVQVDFAYKTAEFVNSLQGHQSH